MHDVIQEMGWQIVRDGFSNIRLWQVEEMHDLIMRNKKPKAIEAMVLQDKEYNVNRYDEKLLRCNIKVIRSNEASRSSHPINLPFSHDCSLACYMCDFGHGPILRSLRPLIIECKIVAHLSASLISECKIITRLCIYVFLLSYFAF